MIETEATPDLAGYIAQGDLEGLETALRAGGDADAADRWGVTALMKAAIQGNERAVALLLRHGARIDERDRGGNTALMQACARGHLGIARQLMSHGADPAQANKWGFGARDWAAWSEHSAEAKAILAGRQA